MERKEDLRRRENEKSGGKKGDSGGKGVGEEMGRVRKGKDRTDRLMLEQS